MAKKQVKVANRCRLIISGINVNGEPVDDLDYSRTEYADGSVEESGRIPGWPAGATLDQVIRAAVGLPPAIAEQPNHASASSTDLAKARTGRRRKGRDA